MTQVGRGPSAEVRIEAALVTVLRMAPGGTLEQLRDDAAAALGDPGLPLDEVRAALVRLQDAERVMMRVGWYRLAEAERQRGAA